MQLSERSARGTGESDQVRATGGSPSNLSETASESDQAEEMQEFQNLAAEFNKGK
jgi:hypothetical protein